MLLLLFETHDGRYALDSQHIVEIIPFIKAKKIPTAPGYVVGLVNYHGLPVPILDLCSLEGGEACRPFYSTRLILLRYPLDGEEKIIGLAAERVTDVIKSSDTEIRSTGILLDKNLGLEVNESGQEELVQLFDIERMIPEDIVRELF